MARPAKYNLAYAKEAYRQCLLGKTDRQLAEYFHVSESTLNSWKRQYPEFLQSLRRGKDRADGRAAESLYKRVRGFQYQEVTYEKIQTEPDENENICEEVWKKKVVTKKVLPDVGACLAWLKSRQPLLWREFDPALLTDEQIEQIISTLQKRKQ